MAKAAIDALNALTPLDGRYKEITHKLSSTLSEYGLIKIRIEIEAKYLIALSRAGIVRKLTKKEEEHLLSFAEEFTEENAAIVKTLEKETRHDVKAMERTFRDMLPSTLQDVIEMVHFGLTSSDINNISFNLMLMRASEKVMVPSIKKVVANLAKKAEEYKDLVMQARTHGQPAVPTTLGKEFAVYAWRLSKQLGALQRQKLTGKLNGAVGNYNALFAAHPAIDWIKFSERFIASIGLEPNLYTTQINNYDDVAEYLQTLERINNILISLDQDAWRYISDAWFVQAALPREVGSSTMPQKINPIDFENSEGNLGMANSIFEFMAKKLPISRLQRDLSDSTVIRNLGTALGFCLVGYTSTLKGLLRIKADADAIRKALHSDWSILTEAAQTILRREGSARRSGAKAATPDPYSLIARKARGKKLDEAGWKELVRSLPVAQKIKTELANLTPQNYTGLAVKLTEKAIKEIRSANNK